jgi:hypothetical protein
LVFFFAFFFAMRNDGTAEGFCHWLILIQPNDEPEECDNHNQRNSHDQVCVKQDFSSIVSALI